MQKHEASHMAYILDAFSSGKKLQEWIGNQGDNKIWKDVDDLDLSKFIFSPEFTYRVKPKKKTRLMTSQELIGKVLINGIGEYLVCAISNHDEEDKVYCPGFDERHDLCWNTVETLHKDGYELENGDSLEVEIDG